VCLMAWPEQSRLRRMKWLYIVGASLAALLRPGSLPFESFEERITVRNSATNKKSYRKR
jgi:hypothetical protein